MTTLNARTLGDKIVLVTKEDITITGRGVKRLEAEKSNKFLVTEKAYEKLSKQFNIVWGRSLEN